jgi:hypothetical protein
MKRFYWTAITNDERIKAIDEITSIVNRYATILNSQRFSDISLNLVLEVDKGRLNDLQNGLNRIMALDCADTDFSDSNAECVVLLSITFTKGTGDLEIENPNIPE